MGKIGTIISIIVVVVLIWAWFNRNKLLNDMFHIDEIKDVFNKSLKGVTQFGNVTANVSTTLANKTAGGVTNAANQTASGATQAANQTASGATNAANQVARSGRRLF